MHLFIWGVILTFRDFFTGFSRTIPTILIRIINYMSSKIAFKGNITFQRSRANSVSLSVVNLRILLLRSPCGGSQRQCLLCLRVLVEKN